jgi:putative oligomerization/nucleic acid binding protein
MKLLTDNDLRVNQQAASVAATVLGQPVQAATRCEQVSTDMAAEAAGVGSLSRGMMRGMMAMNKASSVGRMGDSLRSAGLPNSFILAVTETQVHAIEDKQKGGELVPGDVLRSWDRAGFLAKRGPDILNTATGVPEDRQVLILHLPIEGGNNRYLQAAARNTAGVGGKPYKFMVAKDAPSQAVVDALVTANAAPNVMFGGNVMVGGMNMQEMMAQANNAMAAAGAAQAPAAPADPIERLTKLADLHSKGILTDEEFATQKASILAAS